jgi:AcrR family transcriptional regulator
MTTGMQERMKISRRERNTTATRAKIFDVAHELFSEKGYDAVTVQHIADTADIGIGTLFYHASSKTELFLMVYNSSLEQAIQAGRKAQNDLPADASLCDRILALSLPIADAMNSPEAGNFARYHKELLFGDSNDRYRRAGIDLVRGFESEVAGVLGGALHIDAHSLLTRLTARAIFAALHFDIALPETDLNPATRFAGAGSMSLRMQIQIIVEGFESIGARHATPNRGELNLGTQAAHTSDDNDSWLAVIPAHDVP